jgi:hypothetical protein
MTSKLIDTGGHLKTPLCEAATTASRPEFFRLPSRGGDPHFGFTRTFYYAGEGRGYWRLVRIRERNKLRGVTLVPYDAVARFIRQTIEQEDIK